MDDLDIYDEKILEILINARRELTTNQISRFSGISYNTTKNHLEELFQNGHIFKAREPNRIYWWIE